MLCGLFLFYLLKCSFYLFILIFDYDKNRLYTMVYTIINRFYNVLNNLCTMVNKLFTKKRVFVLIVLKMDMKLNKNLKIKYFCTKLLILAPKLWRQKIIF